MKNHKRVNGKLLQTNKKWSHLKASQKEWISGLLRERFVSFLKQNQNPPNELSIEQILADVMVHIEKKEIWIPVNEVRKYFQSRKIRWQNQYMKQAE